MAMNNFIGKDGFFWWMGVVEDNNDPLGLGRLRVRIFGFHTDNLQEMPTETLPWSIPCQSTNVSMTAGAGLPGDYAFGFFGDGQAHQMPVVVGIMPGIPRGGSSAGGFSAGTHYPVGEPTTSRLHRNYKIDETAIGRHNNDLDSDVSSGDGSWSEPASSYNAQIPYNRVTETVSGHVFEMDDTPGAERIHLSHKSDTFFEIAPDGSKVTKVQGTNYEIYVKDNNIHVKGNCNLTVDSGVNIYVKGDANIKVDGNVNETVGGSYNITAGGDFTVKAATINLN